MKQIFWVMIFFVMGCATYQAKESGVTAKLTVERDKEEKDAGQFFVEVKFDGSTEKCFLDTGATSTTVKDSPYFASYASLRESKFMGVSGKPAIAARIHINDIELGGTHFSNSEIIRLPDQPGILSTLGIDLFQNQSTGFELKDHRIVFSTSQNTTDPFEIGQKGHIIVPVTLEADVTKMIWDTGAGLTTVDQKVIAAHPANFSFIKNVEVGDAVTDSSSQMKIYTARELKIGSLQLKNIRVLSTDFSAIQEKLGDKSIVGAVGFNVLESYNWYFSMKTKTFSVR